MGAKSLFQSKKYKSTVTQTFQNISQLSTFQYVTAQ